MVWGGGLLQKWGVLDFAGGIVVHNIAGMAAVIGIVSGVVCYYAVEMKNNLHWDDALDVWGVHGVGGFLGILMLGLFATKSYNPAGADGLLYGNPSFFFKQVVAVLFSSVWAFAFTYGMLKLISVFTPVKVDQVSQQVGLDESLHGEHAYETLDDDELLHLEHLHAMAKLTKQETHEPELAGIGK